MSFTQLYGLPAASDYDLISCSRFDLIQKIKRKSVFDIIVVGGGIHGAAVARLAAFNGFRTLLLEKNDYASGTSSRSSKMAHGGLRYLEMLDLQQVFEGIRAREDLFSVADHLVKPSRFLIPIYGNQKLLKWKMRIGLFLYDLLVTKPQRRHYWVNREDLNYESFNRETPNLLGCFVYTDGIINDTRLVLETILAARQEGALCLNYAEVTTLQQGRGGEVQVGWRDTLRDEKHDAQAGVVINCAGPWVPDVGRITPGELSRRIRFSQGAHLLFAREWKDPPVFLPMEGKSRYYWVWPHFAGTLVGTTEREVKEAVPDPQPLQDEVSEIMARLQKDLPGHGFSRENLHYGFAGLRTLALRSPNSRGTTRLSRKHIWSYAQGVISLVGGKFTTASWTAFEGLSLALKLSGLSRKLVSLRGRKLPGAGIESEVVREFQHAASREGIPREVITRAVNRLGTRVAIVQQLEKGLELIGGCILRGEVLLSLRDEQVETFEDLFRRRLDLEYLPSHGLEALDGIKEICREHAPHIDLIAGESAYRERLKSLKAILQS